MELSSKQQWLPHMERMTTARHILDALYVPVPFVMHSYYGVSLPIRDLPSGKGNHHMGENTTGRDRSCPVVAHGTRRRQYVHYNFDHQRNSDRARQSTSKLTSINQRAGVEADNST